jgi:hypothetical protein
MRKYLKAFQISALLLAGILFSLSFVHAQDETSISVLPAESTIIINGINIGEVEIYITNGVNVNAFDITLTYDPDLLVLESVVWGDYLSNLRRLTETNNSGFYRLSVTQWGQPGVYGDGTLLHLTFSGIAPGVSEITITNLQLSTPQGSGSFPPVNNGTITAAYDPGPLDKYPVTGEIELERRSDRGGIPVSLTGGAMYLFGPYSTLSLSQLGTNLIFGDVVADTYVITSQQPRYLNLDSFLNKTFSVSADETTINPLELKLGNPEWSDNVIDDYDLDLVDLWFDLTFADLEPGETLDGDVNFDGLVNVQDLAIVAGRYGLSAVDVYKDWVP